MDLSSALGMGSEARRIKMGAKKELTDAQKEADKRQLERVQSGYMKPEGSDFMNVKVAGEAVRVQSNTADLATKGLSPGTLIVLQRELETNPGFKDYLNEMLKDPDPAKRIFIEMQKSKMNVLNPKAFDKDVNTKKWQWSRRRVKPIVMNTRNKEMSGLGEGESSESGGIFGMIAMQLVQMGAKELQKPENQKKAMDFTQKKTSNKTELRKRREEVMNEYRKVVLPANASKAQIDAINSKENYAKAEKVAGGSITFEEAFGLASKLSPGVVKKIATDEIGYQNAQAAKLSEESAEALGVRQERKAGITSSNTTMLIGGGIAAAVLAFLAMRRK